MAQSLQWGTNGVSQAKRKLQYKRHPCLAHLSSDVHSRQRSDHAPIPNQGNALRRVGENVRDTDSCKDKVYTPCHTAEHKPQRPHTRRKSQCHTQFDPWHDRSPGKITPVSPSGRRGGRQSQRNDDNRTSKTRAGMKATQSVMNACDALKHTDNNSNSDFHDHCGKNIQKITRKKQKDAPRKRSLQRHQSQS